MHGTLKVANLNSEPTNYAQLNLFRMAKCFLFYAADNDACSGLVLQVFGWVLKAVQRCCSSEHPKSLLHCSSLLHTLLAWTRTIKVNDRTGTQLKRRVCLCMCVCVCACMFIYFLYCASSALTQDDECDLNSDSCCTDILKKLQYSTYNPLGRHWYRTASGHPSVASLPTGYFGST